tara:strand:+ start:513 stop:734 length:222 start_codon:yes stop_codon:yes gene_type:complete
MVKVNNRKKFKNKIYNILMYILRISRNLTLKYLFRDSFKIEKKYIIPNKKHCNIDLYNYFQLSVNDRKNFLIN